MLIELIIIKDMKTDNLHTDNTSSKSKEQENKSFFTFLAKNYKLSSLFLPKKKPINDSLTENDKERLSALIKEKDYYEINTIIKSRYEAKKI